MITMSFHFFLHFVFKIQMSFFKITNFFWKAGPNKQVLNIYISRYPEYILGVPCTCRYILLDKSVRSKSNRRVRATKSFSRSQLLTQHFCPSKYAYNGTPLGGKENRFSFWSVSVCILKKAFSARLWVCERQNNSFQISWHASRSRSIHGRFRAWVASE